VLLQDSPHLCYRGLTEGGVWTRHIRATHAEQLQGGLHRVKIRGVRRPTDLSHLGQTVNLLLQTQNLLCPARLRRLIELHKELRGNVRQPQADTREFGPLQGDAYCGAT